MVKHGIQSTRPQRGTVQIFFFVAKRYVCSARRYCQFTFLSNIILYPGCKVRMLNGLNNCLMWYSWKNLILPLLLFVFAHKYKGKTILAIVTFLKWLGHSKIKFVVGFPHQYKTFFWFIPVPLNAWVSIYLNFNFWVTIHFKNIHFTPIS